MQAQSVVGHLHLKLISVPDLLIFPIKTFTFLIAEAPTSVVYVTLLLEIAFYVM